MCGDGSTTFKSRGWFLKKDSYIYHCFNCNVTLSSTTVLQEFFPDVYQEYVFEKLKGNSKQTSNKVEFKENKNIDISDDFDFPIQKKLDLDTCINKWVNKASNIQNTKQIDPKVAALIKKIAKEYNLESVPTTNMSFNDIITFCNY